MEGIGRDFIEKTKYKNMGTSAQEEGIPYPPLQLEYNGTSKLIDLIKPENIKIENYDLRKSIENRKSIRKYTDQPLTLEELSYILWCTQGVKEIYKERATLRNVPSAGARHAFETFLLINNVEQIPEGIYRYLSLEHKLLAVDNTTDVDIKIVEGCLGQKFVRESAVTFIWVAVPNRMTWRYNERGYRYLYLDAGHICQNLYLVAESLKCGVCAIAAYDDDKMNEILKLDGIENFVIYIATIGKI